MAEASKANPFVNSLGMEFVPVPGTEVLMCRTDTRVRDFREYASDAGYKQSGGAKVLKIKKMKSVYSAEWTLDASASWEAPGFKQSDDHPVVCVNWQEARAFCMWLGEKEGRNYRLPKDAEWSSAVGLGKYPWGSVWPPPKGAGNFSDETFAAELHATGLNYLIAKGYRDGAARTAPVANYDENRLGLYDMAGNVSQWCEDIYRANMNPPESIKYTPEYMKETAADGTRFRVKRGSSWGDSGETVVRSLWRERELPSTRIDLTGFRCVLVLPGGHE